MDYVNNSYSSGDTMSSSLANMTINDQHHQENGVAKMKGQTNQRDTSSVLCIRINGDVNR